MQAQYNNKSQHKLESFLSQVFTLAAAMLQFTTPKSVWLFNI